MITLIPFVLVAAMIGAHIYFTSRRASVPSRTERVAAMIWLIIRRIICFGAAALCLVGTFAGMRAMLTDDASVMNVVTIMLSLSFGYILIHWGRYGTGYEHYRWKDDRPDHEARRRRYGWRW